MKHNNTHTQKSKNRIYCTWKNAKGLDCKLVGPASMCFCGHRFKEHEFLEPKLKKVHHTHAYEGVLQTIKMLMPTLQSRAGVWFARPEVPVQALLHGTRSHHQEVHQGSMWVQSLRIDVVLLVWHEVRRSSDRHGDSPGTHQSRQIGRLG